MLKGQKIDKKLMAQIELIHFIPIINEHPNVLSIIHLERNVKYTKNLNSSLFKKLNYFVVEYAEGGLLLDYIHKFGPLSARVARYYIKKLIPVMILG